MDRTNPVRIGCQLPNILLSKDHTVEYNDKGIDIQNQSNEIHISLQKKLKMKYITICFMTHL